MDPSGYYPVVHGWIRAPSACRVQNLVDYEHLCGLMATNLGLYEHLCGPMAQNLVVYQHLCGPRVDLDKQSCNKNGRFLGTIDEIKGSSGQLGLSRANELTPALHPLWGWIGRNWVFRPHFRQNMGYE